MNICQLFVEPSMTDMVFEPLFATYTLLFSGLTSIPYGKLPTLIVASILSEVSTVTTGEAIRTALIREIGVAPSRVTSIPTGVDPARFAPRDKLEARRQLRLPETTPLVGICATLRSWKGHRFLVEAMPLLAHRDAQLLIVGEGPQRETLQHQIAALGLGDRVRMIGNQNDVAPWFAAFDVFALPSYADEGVPQALVQAMYVGAPCVTTMRARSARSRSPTVRRSSSPARTRSRSLRNRPATR